MAAMSANPLPSLTFWQSLAGRLHAGEPAFLALVAANTRHSPGTAGARLFVTRDGEPHGTIGGGIMEHRVLQRAAAALAQQEPFAPELLTLHHSKSTDGERSGMICAGSQTNLYLVCHPETDTPAIDRLVALLAEDRSGSLVIDPGGLRVEEQPPDPARPRMHLEQDNGDGWRYEEQLLERRRLAILGGGHCGQALARAMAPLGYATTVFETRPGILGDGFAAARVELVPDFREAGGRIPHPELTCVVVMTTDFPNDVRALTGVLGRPFPFVGAMGAPAKLEQVFGRLREEGFTDEQLERLHAPVGLPIGSSTPEEIAVSVAAQILQRHQKAITI